jgi:hypothetical protein
MLIAAFVQARYIAATFPTLSGIPSWAAFVDIAKSLQTHTFGIVWISHSGFCALAVFVAATAWFVCETGRQRALMTAFIAINALQLWSIACRQTILPNPIDNLSADRYYVLFKLFFWIWSALTLRRLLVGHRNLVLPVVLAATTAIAVANPPTTLRRMTMPDLQWRHHAERMDRGEAVTAPINPVPWTLSVPAR